MIGTDCYHGGLLSMTLWAATGERLCIMDEEWDDEALEYYGGGSKANAYKTLRVGSLEVCVKQSYSDHADLWARGEGGVVWEAAEGLAAALEYSFPDLQNHVCVEVMPATAVVALIYDVGRSWNRDLRPRLRCAGCRTSSAHGLAGGSAWPEPGV